MFSIMQQLNKTLKQVKDNTFATVSFALNCFAGLCIRPIYSNSYWYDECKYKGNNDIDH